ncbi:MAG: acyl-CoA synthetase [Luteolibacter sp.]|uniref:acyl-CoA synthetase n=1 Tax=Luteolibacter sp. TaxID=1962973 RepID=UPI003263D6AA
MQELSLISRARNHAGRIAVRADGREHTYEELLEASSAVAASLLDGAADLAEARVAFLAPAGFSFLAIQWGIWRAGGIAVPLSISATQPELEYALRDSEAALAIAIPKYADRVSSNSNIRLIVDVEIDPTAACELPEIDPARRAMILYTSGTTSTPKGVVSTHAAIESQIRSLVEAWEWSADDRIPLFLPMHHVHGIINIACCALWSGAVIEAFPKFDMGKILQRVAAGAYTVFMAVPTIYVKLIETLESGGFDSESVCREFANMRLMVSGSAALPASVHEKWSALTGQNLLERYGMTETAMIISNPLHGERRAGAVGQPLPSVEVRLKSETGEIIMGEGESGEIQVRGPVVFREYWDRPQATAESFDEGWFRTGDVAVMERGYYRIMGRLSVDIIKSGGYKLSALEIEAALLDHPSIRECAVVGVKDDTWGEMVAVAAVLMEGLGGLEIGELQAWCKDRLSHYKMPRKLLVVMSLPRNAMGKVTKKEVAATLEA